MADWKPDLQKAQRISDAVNNFGATDLGAIVADVLAREDPDLQTLAAAVAQLRPATPNPHWHEQMRLALQAPLNVRLVHAVVDAQEHLSQAADRLARRNFWVSILALVVSLAGVAMSAL